MVIGWVRMARGYNDSLSRKGQSLPCTRRWARLPREEGSEREDYLSRFDEVKDILFLGASTIQLLRELVLHRRAAAVPIGELREAYLYTVVHARSVFDPLQRLRLVEQLCAVAARAGASAGKGGGEAQRDAGDDVRH